MPFDPTKIVQTRDGRKARIVCLDRTCEHYPIVGLVTNINTTYEVAQYFSSAGESGSNSIYDDLINIPDIPRALKGMDSEPDNPFMQELIKYLAKEDLVVVPRTIDHLTLESYEQIDNWNAVIKAYEENSP